MICENCSKEHDGSFGSGRFCSRNCANKRNHSKETKLKIGSKLKGKATWSKGVKIGEIKPRKVIYCKYCKKEIRVTFNSKQIFCSQECFFKYKSESGEFSKKMYELYALNKKPLGGGTTKWYAYKNIKVQGTYELRTCYILDKMKELDQIKDWEYTNDRIKYYDNEGKQRTYILDFKVFNKDNSFYYIEVKGYKTQMDILKWKATRERYKLNIWFKENLEENEKKLDLKIINVPVA